MNLFIDTTNWNLIYILEKDDNIIDTYFKKDIRKISEIAISELNIFLNKNNLTIREVNNLYLTTGPGSYTGVRIGLAIAKTLKTLNNAYNTFTMNSLRFQSGGKDSISLLDARGNKSYIGIYKDNKAVITETIIENDKINELNNKFVNLEVFKDYENISFENNYLKLKTHFDKVTKIEKLEPVYIKNFI